jgi:ornithine cyclodeaminase
MRFHGSTHVPLRKIGGDNGPKSEKFHAIRAAWQNSGTPLGSMPASSLDVQKQCPHAMRRSMEGTVSIILTDDDIVRLADMPAAIARVRALISAGTMTPPRHRVEFAKGTELVFSVGGDSRVGGVRAYYSRFAKHFDDQVVAVWDMTTGALKGLTVGFELGVLRMGAIGGVTIDAIAPKSTRTMAVIGAGRQACSHIAAALAVRSIRHITISGRDQDRCAAFAENVAKQYGVKTTCAAPEAAVDGAEIVVLATTSLRPVVQAKWLNNCSLIHSVGFKSPAAKEQRKWTSTCPTLPQRSSPTACPRWLSSVKSSYSMGPGMRALSRHCATS